MPPRIKATPSILLVLILTLTICSIAQRSVVDTTRRTADYQSAQVPKDMQAILKSQPPIPYGWAVAEGFGLGMLFTCLAQWFSRILRDARLYRKNAK
jgi:hypothetical protein